MSIYSRVRSVCVYTCPWHFVCVFSSSAFRATWRCVVEMARFRSRQLPSHSKEISSKQKLSWLVVCVCALSLENMIIVYVVCRWAKWRSMCTLKKQSASVRPYSLLHTIIVPLLRIIRIQNSLFAWLIATYTRNHAAHRKLQKRYNQVLAACVTSFIFVCFLSVWQVGR